MTSPQQLKKLRDAIIEAFLSKSSLKQLLFFELNKNLDEIAPESNLQDVVFTLIQAARAEGWLGELVEAARKERPGNKGLQEIAQELLGQGRDSVADSREEQQEEGTRIVTNPGEEHQKILVLAANPLGTSRLRIDEELREIKEGLRRGKAREKFSLESAQAVRYRDIHRAVMDYEPQIIHFSGHGSGEKGLVFEDGQGQVKLVEGRSLAGLFGLFAEQVKCVVLNACYSEEQARAIAFGTALRAIAQEIDYVVGMRQEIGERAAIEFAVGFYDALAAGRTIEFGYKLGCQLIQVAGIREELTPKLLGKKVPSLNFNSQLEVQKAVIEDVRGSNLLPQQHLQVFEYEVVRVDAQGRIKEREKRQAKCLIEDVGKGITLEMVAIPGGRFLMGAPETEKGSNNFERPRHEVTVQPFFMGKYPVTQAQWRAVATLPRIKRDLKPDPSDFKGDNRPVEQVSWYDAVEFCDRLSQYTGKEYRLASEAEWEYACRAGTTTPYHFGETLTDELANYQIKKDGTTEVRNFSANGFGLYDIHGNVYEWCADHWYDNYKGAPIDGSGWLSNNVDQHRLLRGGSCGNDPVFCRSAFRNDFNPDFDYYDFGFRVVCANVQLRDKQAKNEVGFLVNSFWLIR